MAAMFDMDDVAGLLSEFEITGGALEDQELLTAIHRPCQQMVLRTIDGEAFANELFMVLLQHDCEDAFAEPVVLDLRPSEIPYEEDDEDEDAHMTDEDREAFVGPIQDLSTLPNLNDPAIWASSTAGMFAGIACLLRQHSPVPEPPSEEAA